MTCFIRPFKKDSEKGHLQTPERRTRLGVKRLFPQDRLDINQVLRGLWRVRRNQKVNSKICEFVPERLLQTNLTNQMDLQSIFVPICW